MGSQAPPAHYPITGVCIVTDPQKCPPLYAVLLKSHDRKEDCDLGTESLLRRSPRFICFTRTYAMPGRQNVLVDLQLINEKEIPNNGYVAVNQTCDSGEKALKKKQISIKMVSRDAAANAICDIVCMSKAKRAPEGYTMIGEVNGLALCVRMGPIPIETQAFSHSAVQPIRPAPLPPIGRHSPVPPTTIGKPPVPAPRITLAARSDSINANPLADIPFQLNVKLQDIKALMKDVKVPVTREYRSAIDIQNEYDYQFTLERSAVQRTSTS